MLIYPIIILGKILFISQRKYDMDKNGLLIKNKKSVDDYISPKKKKRWKPWVIFIGAVILVVVVWLGIGAYSAFSKIITKNVNRSAPFLSFLGDVDPDQLKGEGDGRINILLIGIGGKGHPGGQLADTIQIVSIDPQNKKLAALSLPRDLYIPVAGTKTYSKINSIHADGEAKSEGQGAVLLKETVSNILDLPIHYYIKLDFSGFKKLINEMGGIDIYVQEGISDPYYPAEDMIGYEPFSIKSGKQHMSGDIALKYARSRETTSDFDRSRRQQEIMMAIKEKTLSAGVLANPAKVSAIMNVLGEHLRTDLQMKEIERLIQLFKEIDTSNIISKVLDNSADGPLVSYSNGGYYLKPKTGNFKEVARIAHEIFSDPYLVKENARLEVLNGSSTSGIGKEVSDTLKSYGYNVANLDKADKTYTKTIIYDYSGGKNPYTIKFLQDRFKAETKTQPTSSKSGIDITLIIGDDYPKEE